MTTQAYDCGYKDGSYAGYKLAIDDMIERLNDKIEYWSGTAFSQDSYEAECFANEILDDFQQIIDEARKD